MSTFIFLLFTVQAAGAINNICPADYAPTLLRVCKGPSGSTCTGSEHFCRKETCCAYRPTSTTFHKWKGKGGEEVIAVEPLKDCSKKLKCDQAEFCDYVYISTGKVEDKPNANGKNPRKVCFKVPQIIGDIQTNTMALKLCSSLKDCGKFGVCYPLAQKVYDFDGNKFATGICTKLAAVTQDQKEEFGDLCGNSQDCTADKFRSGKRGDAIAGCKKFNVTNGFLSHDAGICLRANVLCLSRMKATQPFYSANGTALCSKEVREFKNNDLGSICCPEPLSYSLYWTTVEYENKLPIDYEKDGVGKACTDSRECRNEEFCDDAVNAFNGIGAKDKSGTNNQPLRYCYRMPIHDFLIIGKNEKKVCATDDECSGGSCRMLPMYDGSKKPIGFCAIASTTKFGTTSMAATTFPSQQEDPTTASRPVDSSDTRKDQLRNELIKCEKKILTRLANTGTCPDGNRWPMILLSASLIVLLITNVASMIYIWKIRRSIQAVTPNEPVAEAKTPQINEKVATVDRVATKSTKRNQPGDQKRCIRKKKKMTPEHIEYIKNIQRAEKEDASSGKFKKRGPIVIPKSPTVSQLASRADEETNTPLHNVIYDPSDNEVFDIGTQVDEIKPEKKTIDSVQRASKTSGSLLNMKTQPQAASNDSEVAKKSSPPK